MDVEGGETADTLMTLQLKLTRYLERMGYSSTTHTHTHTLRFVEQGEPVLGNEKSGLVSALH